MDGDFHLGDWRVEPRLNAVSRNGTIVHLQPKIMQVLVCLAQHSGNPVSKEELLEAVWPGTFVTDDVLTRAISELRRVFEDDAQDPHFIQTIPKRGYRLVVPVEPAHEAQDSPQIPPAPKSRSILGKRRFLLVAGGLVSLLLILLVARVIRGKKEHPPEPGSAAIHSIAVLPLQNLSADPAQEYFSDGLTDALITDLAQIGNLKVISRTSSMQFKAAKKSLPQIARELGVDGIVEGTVQRSGNRVRITAQLIHGPSDKHVWANSFEDDSGDAFKLERDVTQEIAAEIETHLEPPSEANLQQPRPVNSKVFDAYLQGNYHLHKVSRGAGEAEGKKAVEYFQRALDADANFAPAYVGIASAYANSFYGSRQDTTIMRQAAERALALAPNSSEAWAILGFSKAQSRDWSGAEADYRKALLLNPNNAAAHDDFCQFLGVRGRLDEGKRECEIAQELDPSNDHLSWILFLRGEYDRSIAIAKMMLENHPDDGFSHHLLYQAYAKKGMYKESIQELERTLTLYGFSELAADLGRAFVNGGYTGAMRAYARGLEHLSSTKQLSMPMNLAEVYANLGDQERAFHWLEQAYIQRGVVTTGADIDFLEADPMLVPLRSDPRFADLVRRLGLPQ